MSILAGKIRRFNTPSKITLSGNRTLTELELLADVIKFEGTLAADATVYMPFIDGGLWLFKNSTSGGYSVTVGAVEIPNGQSAILYCLGTEIALFSPISIAGHPVSTSIGERLIGNSISGEWESTYDSPSTDTVDVDASPLAITSTASMIRLDTGTAGDAWSITLPAVATVPLGRVITMHSGPDACDSIYVYVASGEKMNGRTDYHIEVEPSAGTEISQFFIEFVRGYDGWWLRTVRGCTDTNADVSYSVVS